MGGSSLFNWAMKVTVVTGADSLATISYGVTDIVI